MAYIARVHWLCSVLRPCQHRG